MPPRREARPGAPGARAQTRQSPVPGGSRDEPRPAQRVGAQAGPRRGAGPLVRALQDAQVGPTGRDDGEVAGTVGAGPEIVRVTGGGASGIDELGPRAQPVVAPRAGLLQRERGQAGGSPHIRGPGAVDQPAIAEDVVADGAEDVESPWFECRPG